MEPEAFVVTKKDGFCRYCDDVKDLLNAKGVSYREFAASSDQMKLLRAQWGCTATFPQVFFNDRLIGGYEATKNFLDEPILAPNDDRHVLFPVKYPELFEAYKRAVASFWTSDEIDFSKDLDDWNSLTSEEREFVKHVLAFFAGADGIVNENLAKNFADEVRVPEARAFYAYQIFNESVHSETYSLLLDTYVKDPGEKDRLLKAVMTVPAVKKKAAWANKWISSNLPFGVRLVAFACVEAILFSSSFAAIFWLKKRGLMQGLSFSNELISRDEAMHQEFATLLFDKIVDRPSEERIRQVVTEAVADEQEFARAALPFRLGGMNADSMCKYVEFVADRLLQQLGCSKMYGSANPFDFMEMISLSGKTNFFERRLGEYRKAVVEDIVINTEDDF